MEINKYFMSKQEIKYCGSMFTFIISKSKYHVHIYNGIESGKEEEWFRVLGKTLIFLSQTKHPRKKI
jgi:hypothetical protein